MSIKSRINIIEKNIKTVKPVYVINLNYKDHYCSINGNIGCRDIKIYMKSRNKYIKWLNSIYKDSFLIIDDI